MLGVVAAIVLLLNGDPAGAAIVFVISLFVGFGAYRAFALAKQPPPRP